MRESEALKDLILTDQTGDFGIIHKINYKGMCKTSFFHTVFHNLWKSRWEIHRSALSYGDFLWKKEYFSTPVSVSFP